MNILRSTPISKSILITILLCLFSVFIFAQTTVSRIEYECTLTLKQKMSGDDSILVIKNLDTIKTPIELPKYIDIKSTLMTLTTIGNENTSKIIPGNYINSGWKNSYQTAQFDSIVYRKGNWVKFMNNSFSNLGNRKFEYQYCNEEKIILGYRCSKINFYSKVDSSKGVIWITKSLPATLMPFGGYQLLEGAILECNFSNSGISYRATSID